MTHNIPDIRLQSLRQRLATGHTIVAQEVAAEFEVSLDTVRRDILLLETEGKAQRVRGGAVPVSPPASPLLSRLQTMHTVPSDLIASTIAAIGPASTLLIDGGVTTLSLVAHLPRQIGRLVVTPSPWVAIACQTRDIDVFLLGGSLSASGGIATGAFTTTAAQDITADIAILGACGLDATFGLSSDDFEESQMKKAMNAAAARTFVVATADKIGRKSRHQTLPLSALDCVFTDANDAQLAPLRQAGAKVVSP